VARDEFLGQPISVRRSRKMETGARGECQQRSGKDARSQEKSQGPKHLLAALVPALRGKDPAMRRANSAVAWK